MIPVNISSIARLISPRGLHGEVIDASIVQLELDFPPIPCLVRVLAIIDSFCLIATSFPFLLPLVLLQYMLRACTFYFMLRVPVEMKEHGISVLQKTFCCGKSWSVFQLSDYIQVSESSIRW